MLCVHCTGMLSIKCKQVYTNGACEHFRQYYNLMDFSILALYLASYAVYLATYYRVTEASRYFNASTRIYQAVVDCDPRQMKRLKLDVTEDDNNYGYFMHSCKYIITRCSPSHCRMVSLDGHL